MRHLLTKLLLLSILITVASLESSCSNDDDEITPKEEDARYYVKYEATIHTFSVKTTKYISFSNEEGSQILTFNDKKQNIQWEGTYGPVTKDFIANLDCSSASYDDTSIYARISVCKDKEPFVVKAEGSQTKGNYLSLTNKIDF